MTWLDVLVLLGALAVVIACMPALKTAKEPVVEAAPIGAMGMLVGAFKSMRFSPLWPFL